ncbi:hypothetical protein ACIOZM_21350 [Pseudomonas sp. NPDC087346]|uniref:glycine-rich domain-containing protein n=1 Tax=Pseudomonas sp. NPDC087346 TaxID=3364438 RepID=UPI0038018A1E
MADLPESNEWTEGIYQLETSDPVLGGPEGIDNLQGKQLANRTKWLKDQIAKIVDGTNAIGKAIQLKTARTLEFKGAATGSGIYDGSADTEITLTLADSGIVAGSFTKVTFNAKGLAIDGSNPTTLAGYGIDPATKAEAEAGDNAKPLTAQGALWVLGKVKGFAKFTVNGSFTVPTGVTQIWLSGCAGGGGGGSGSGGTNSSRGSGGGSGGAGQSIQKEPYAVTPGQVIPITIGAAGSGGVGVGTQNAVGNVGTNGGNTVVGTLVTLTAGGGGSYGTDGTGGTRGAGWPNGSHGSDGVLAGVGGGSGDGHVGASGPFGGGGGGSRAVGSSASNASGYGAGGGGGAGGGAPGTPSSNGGNGSPGLVLIEY